VGRALQGQVSVELIIIIAAVLAVALILVVQLQKTAVKGSEALEKESDSVIKEIGSMIRCESSDDCPEDFRCGLADGTCEPV